MEYLFIVILQLLGIGFQVGFKVYELDKKFEDDTLEDVFSTFWKADRITVFISGLILLLNLVVHLIVDEYAPKIREWEYNGFVNYYIIAFFLALLFGYGGQRILYHYFGKAEKVLTDKADKLEKILQ